MKNIQHLIDMRLSGKKPDSVWITFGEVKSPRYRQEFQTLELGAAPCRDYRPFVGLDVTIYSKRWLPEVGQLFDKLIQYAKTVTVLVADFESDIGWWWSKETGKVMYG